ncbi:N-acetylmuramoyl-L-alanine amidase [Corynebacterium phoceense]|uniref:N-acetylmuramoyl-L-alanine amidase n=1 Tax=Corynebacterium phoceense TaxID=1686286 RepID=A0A540R741_9CORY|nr:peptidoglycan recognition family protein [Corynebacterium phoceense]TQE43561.1 N-acetylmuramoyl-L-alanine amidase [Corynebacterium phoceense]
MKDWTTLEPDRVRLLSRHFTPGRGGQKIKHVTIHHMGGVGGLDFCWETWQTREASAHYTVSPTGEIGQAVWDRDTAWANRNLDSNQKTIAIEHSNSGGPEQDWPIGEKTLEEGAHLVAAICKYYKLGRPVSGQNVRFHSIESGGFTECPYHLRPGHKYHDGYIRRAQYWYDQMTSAAIPTKKASAPVSDLTKKYFTDFITGYLGPQFDAIQEIWRQLRGPAGTGWEQLGKNDKGQNLTLVDAVAAIRHDLARIEKKLEER